MFKKFDTTPEKKDVDDVVEKIVSKWNSLVVNFQNTTISLCLMVQDMIKDYPDEAVKDILKKVKEHHNIKRFVSTDRIWQGMRLIRKRPDLIQFHNQNVEEREKVPEEKKPYIKKDGEIFWEFYFELAKQPLSDKTLMMIEIEGKEKKWSFRDLRTKLADTKDEQKEPLGYESKKKEKYELIKQILGICKSLTIDDLKKTIKNCKELQEEYRNSLEKK